MKDRQPCCGLKLSRATERNIIGAVERRPHSIFRLCGPEILDNLHKLDISVIDKFYSLYPLWKKSFICLPLRFIR